ncbi:MAG: AAA family ATPase [Oscillospiraceae bacterium]|jgi:predicted ATPase|nr:AAA family ATPase [Oscillospiraceae bacterium]
MRDAIEIQDAFITKIHITQVRHLQDVDIVLSDTERKHLILTGKNGSGKTSLLEAMRNEIMRRQPRPRQQPWPPPGPVPPNLHAPITNLRASITLSLPNSGLARVICAYVSTKRSEKQLPKAIEPLDISFPEKISIAQNVSEDFLKYIVFLDYQRSGAVADGNAKLANRLNMWFDDFQAALQEIYDCRELQLQYDRQNLTVTVNMPGRMPFGLHEMADGYAALLDIYMELLMRFEMLRSVVEYETPAIMLVDEIETHLHVELQKRVLPFLTRMFPGTQFIVATHSPFVITSLKNAVVFDLEKKERLENPSVYSYEAVVESYLDVGQYSDEMKKAFNGYKALYEKERTAAEEAEFQRLIETLALVPPASKELYVAFRTMEDRRKR